MHHRLRRTAAGKASTRRHILRPLLYVMASGAAAARLIKSCTCNEHSRISWASLTRAGSHQWRQMRRASPTTSPAPITAGAGHQPMGVAGPPVGGPRGRGRRPQAWSAARIPTSRTGQLGGGGGWGASSVRREKPGNATKPGRLLHWVRSCPARCEQASAQPGLHS